MNRKLLYKIFKRIRTLQFPINYQLIVDLLPLESCTKSWSILYAVHPLTLNVAAVMMGVSAGIGITWCDEQTNSFLHVPD